MQYEKLVALVDENPDVVDFAEFGVGVSEEWIESAQERLAVKFPPSYVWWLRNFCGGEINGEEIFSIYEVDFDEVVGGDIVYVNEMNRENGISTDNMLVIQETDDGEMYYFQLSEADADGEFPVYSDTDNDKYADNFIEFLIRKIME